MESNSLNNYCFFRLREELATTSDKAAFDNQSSSLIKLNNGTILYLREVNKFLALVCILREDNFDRQGVIDYNFLCFRNAIQQVFELRNKTSCTDDHSPPLSINEATNSVPGNQSGSIGQNGSTVLAQS